MALFYIVLAIGVILLNLNRIPSVFVSILEGAFRPSAVTGGIVGSMLMSVKKGVSRGIFSNELFCYLCDPFDTAEQNQRYECRNNDTLNQVGGRDRVL